AKGGTPRFEPRNLRSVSRACGDDRARNLRANARLRVGERSRSDIRLAEREGIECGELTPRGVRSSDIPSEGGNYGAVADGREHAARFRCHGTSSGSQCAELLVRPLAGFRSLEQAAQRGHSQLRARVPSGALERRHHAAIPERRDRDCQSPLSSSAVSDRSREDSNVGLGNPPASSERVDGGNGEEPRAALGDADELPRAPRAERRRLRPGRGDGGSAWRGHRGGAIAEPENGALPADFARQAGGKALNHWVRVEAGRLERRLEIAG